MAGFNDRQRGLRKTAAGNQDVNIAAVLRPTGVQRRYLARGVTEPGGQLPLYDRLGRPAPAKTIVACIANGWAEPWAYNPVKPDWLICRLTAKGFRVLNRTPRKRDQV